MIQDIDRTFVVLGMHRSGTSLAASGLKSMGVNMGKKLLPPTPFNPSGHFENEEFMFLNDKILCAAGGSWNNPPSEGAILEQADKFKEEIQAIIKKHSAKMWGWKDPRTTLTIKLFIPYLKHPFFIVCMRDPKEVATSLNNRDGMPIDEGIKLAKEYNKRLISFLDWYNNTLSLG